MESKAKILLIDDDPDFVEATRIVLESSRYNVIVAYDAESGLRKAREEHPNLVLLDVIMPIKNGFTAAEQFKRDPELRKIPVLMLTSFSTKGPGTGIPLSRGLTLEAEDYIEKPITPEELLKKVTYFLRR
jgi:DNA-binding response OmpR family regulator